MRAELLTAIALLGGWFCITAAVARMLALIAPALSAVAWWLSVGLLGLSMGGWKLAATLAREGLYALTRGRNG